MGTDLVYVAVLAILTLVGGNVVFTLFKRTRSPLSAIPGPWYSKYTDLILSYHWIRGHRAFYVHDLHRKYGPVVRLSPTEVDFTALTAVKRIHSFTNPFLKSPWYKNFVSSPFPNVFSTLDPVFHARHRRLLSAPLSDNSLKTVGASVVRERSELTVQRIGEEMKVRGCADVLKWWYFMATDIIGELSFGDSFRMVEIGKKTQYALDLERVAMLGAWRSMLPTLVKIAYYLPLPVLNEAARAGQRLGLYAEKSIQRYRSMEAADPHNVKPTLFTKLYRAGDEGLSPMEIKAEAQAYLIAGTDTTANTLTFLIWSVCRQKDIQKKLVEELAGLPEDFGEQELRSLPYLDQVIQETLRLYSAAPSGLPREVPPGGVDLEGYYMPEGMTATTQAYSFHRDPAIFPEPYRFNPSRWEHETKEMKEAFMPFGCGARICIGLHLAQMELRNATALFFRAFPNAKVSHLEGMSDKDMEPTIYFLHVPKGERCLIQAS
ncbi:cytochrome protein [Lindgomyces ingoldianus]|uniref:Cytochrome protein n=1 Tax=Lindgomyces ingoldianus TaxID=673940 RepID=A0ACB6QAT6_9PLEO|nr:cytochrome protein [Lindgomyces ingoldianus]KAF2463266.1 cytochrome protein [Lindgomyces ingoldianus]